MVGGCIGGGLPLRATISPVNPITDTGRRTYYIRHANNNKRTRGYGFGLLILQKKVSTVLHCMHGGLLPRTASAIVPHPQRCSPTVLPPAGESRQAIHPERLLQNEEKGLGDEKRHALHKEQTADTTKCAAVDSISAAPSPGADKI